MRISDWSSDVCSSDLLKNLNLEDYVEWEEYEETVEVWVEDPKEEEEDDEEDDEEEDEEEEEEEEEYEEGEEGEEIIEEKIGRATGREGMCQYVEISVVGVSVKKKKRRK